MPTATGARRRVALFMDDLFGGGMQKVIAALARGIAERGHAVSVLTGDASGPLRATLPPAVEVVERAGVAAALAALPVRRRPARRTRSRAPSALAAAAAAHVAFAPGAVALFAPRAPRRADQRRSAGEPRGDLGARARGRSDAAARHTPRHALGGCSERAALAEEVPAAADPAHVSGRRCHRDRMRCARRRRRREHGPAARADPHTLQPGGVGRDRAARARAGR